MVQFRPFQGYVVNQQLAPQIICPPNDTLSTEEARKKATPLSYLNVVKPEINCQCEPYGSQIYEEGKNALQNFISNGYLCQDTHERMYIYRMRMGSHVQHGILGLTSIADYEENKIKKHEFTLKKKEEDRTKLIDSQEANAEPVFFTYQGHHNIAERMLQVTQGEKYCEMEADEGVLHTIWLCSPEDSKYFQQAFQYVPELFVADGHHRTQAAYNVGKLRRQRAIDQGITVSGDEDFNFFMSMIVPEKELMIMDYNRVLKTLNGLSSQEFMTQISQSYEITPIADGDIRPRQKHQISMLLDNKWFSLKLRPENYNTSTPLSHIDCQMLTDLILEPILGIKDLKKDERIDFVGGIRGLEELERRCSDDCVAAFAMCPIQMKEIIDVSNAGLIMPPKSTWFEPKPRSGFVVRCFENQTCAQKPVDAKM